MIKHLINMRVIYSLLLLISCAQIQTPIEIGKNYKLDIDITNKEFNATGMIVLPKKPLYTIELEMDEKIDHITFDTCSRQMLGEDGKISFNKKKFTINYTPNEIESKTSCPTSISAFNDKNFYSVGFIDYEDDKTKLPAYNICGSKSEKTNGVSVCQSKISNLELIRFDEDVIVSPDPLCEFPITRGKEFIYKIKPGYCVYVFMSIKDNTKIHRLTTYGYESILMRL